MKEFTEKNCDSLKESLIKMTKFYLSHVQPDSKLSLANLFHGELGRRRAVNFLKILNEFNFKSNLHFCIILQALLSTSSKRLSYDIASTIITGEYEDRCDGSLGASQVRSLSSKYFTQEELYVAAENADTFIFCYSNGFVMSYICKSKLLSHLLIKEVKTHFNLTPAKFLLQVDCLKKFLESKVFLTEQVYSVIPGAFYAMNENPCYDPELTSADPTFSDLSLG